MTAPLKKILEKCELGERGSLGDRMIALRQRCVSCWAREYSDIWPQSINRITAQHELKRHGYPDCATRLASEGKND